LRLSHRERWQYVTASILLLIAELSLRLWSFQTILKTLQQRCVRTQMPSRDAPGLEPFTQVIRLVELADRHGLFAPSCLRQTVVLAWLFSGRGIEVAVRIGVSKTHEDLRAHAWLEQNGEPLGDSSDNQGYVPLRISTSEVKVSFQ